MGKLSNAMLICSLSNLIELLCLKVRQYFCYFLALVKIPVVENVVRYNGACAVSYSVINQL